MSTLTKEELMKKVAELENLLTEEKNNSSKMTDKVKSLIESGCNSIDDIAVKLNTTNKNISSVLTALRKIYLKNNQTIISQKINNNKTMLAIVNLKDLGWL